MTTSLLAILMGLFVGFVTGVFKRVPNQTNVSGVIKYQCTVSSELKVTSTYRVVEYEVNGKIYFLKLNNLIYPRYPLFGKTTVAYDKTNPQNAFLRPGIFAYILTAISISTGIITGIFNILVLLF